MNLCNLYGWGFVTCWKSTIFFYTNAKIKIRRSEEQTTFWSCVLEPKISNQIRFYGFWWIFVSDLHFSAWWSSCSVWIAFSLCSFPNPHFGLKSRRRFVQDAIQGIPNNLYNQLDLLVWMHWFKFSIHVICLLSFDLFSFNQWTMAFWNAFLWWFVEKSRQFYSGITT